MAISSDLDLHSVLSADRRVGDRAHRRAVRRARASSAATTTSVEFVTTGLDRGQRDRIGDLPHGRGILGLLITDPRPLRLARPDPASRVVRLPAPPPADDVVPRACRCASAAPCSATSTSPRRRAAATSPTTDEQLVVALASAAGLVIENARAYGLSERRREWLEASAALTDALQPPVEWEARARADRRDGSAGRPRPGHRRRRARGRTARCARSPASRATSSGPSALVDECRAESPARRSAGRRRRRAGRTTSWRPWSRSGAGSPRAARSSRCSTPRRPGCATSTSASC